MQTQTGTVQQDSGGKPRDKIKLFLYKHSKNTKTLTSCQRMQTEIKPVDIKCVCRVCAQEQDECENLILPTKYINHNNNKQIKH